MLRGALADTVAAPAPSAAAGVGPPPPRPRVGRGLRPPSRRAAELLDTLALLEAAEFRPRAAMAALKAAQGVLLLRG